MILLIDLLLLLLLFFTLSFHYIIELIITPDTITDLSFIIGRHISLLPCSRHYFHISSSIFSPPFFFFFAAIISLRYGAAAIIISRCFLYYYFFLSCHFHYYAIDTLLLPSLRLFIIDYFHSLCHAIEYFHYLLHLLLLSYAITPLLSLDTFAADFFLSFFFHYYFRYYYAMAFFLLSFFTPMPPAVYWLFSPYYVWCLLIIITRAPFIITLFSFLHYCHFHFIAISLFSLSFSLHCRWYFLRRHYAAADYLFIAADYYFDTPPLRHFSSDYFHFFTLSFAWWFHYFHIYFRRRHYFRH